MKPPIRWAGGKTRFLPHLEPYLPISPTRYFEPFVGGGALFFEYGHRAERAYLNDINKPLTMMYRCIGNGQWDRVEEQLWSLLETDYYVMREEFNSKLDFPLIDDPWAIRMSALFIALNFLGYNGLWRTNRNGEYNVPVGKDSKGVARKLTELDFDAFVTAATYLAKATITTESFNPWPFPVRPEAGDIVFADPPYLDTFCAYDASGFNASHHAALFAQAKVWAGNGARVILCGENNEPTRAIYGEPTKVITLSRTIGQSNRKKAEEAIWVL